MAKTVDQILRERQSQQPADEGPGAPYEPVPGNPGLYYIPGTNYVVQYSVDDFDRVSVNPLPLSVGKALLGDLADSSDGGSRLASDDPRYWAMQERELDQELMKMGFTDEAQRRQVLAQLIANRNNTAADTANISLQGAKTLAEAMANPRDATAELYLRNMVGGSTPFGDIANENFGEYGKALAAKVGDLSNMFGKDLEQLRLYRDAIPQPEFYGPETRQQLGLPPTAAQGLTGGGTAPIASPTAAAPAPNSLQALSDRLASMNPQQQYDFRKWTDPDFRAKNPGPAPMAKGGQINFDGLFESRDKPGYSPSSSEGGTNLNLHERAVVVGESGHVYATMGERRPDGSMRAEQLIIKPLKSETDKDKKLEEGKKAIVETQKKTMASFATGGTVNATPDEFMEQLRQYLGSLGGSGGGTGQVETPLQSPRLLAGAPWNALLEDPDAMDYSLSGYSALGISPRNLAATVKRFTPNSPINNIPRISF